MGKTGERGISVKEFFDKDTWTLTYVVFDKETKDAIVIDPVWDYDPAASKLSEQSLQLVKNFIESMALHVHLIAETHAHADHITGAQPLKNYFKGAQIGIGASITKVQEVFKGIFHLPSTFKTDGSQFDLLFEEGKSYKAGSLELNVISTPGHTPACSSYLIENHLFTGDAIFMPDYGTGRCDFPAGSAEDLYLSIQKIYELPDSTLMYTGHDYMPGGRDMRFCCSLKEQKESNIHIRKGTTKEEFVKFRTERDKSLAAPRLLLPSVQVNIDGGHLPPPESNGLSYLKIPLRVPS